MSPLRKVTIHLGWIFYLLITLFALFFSFKLAHIVNWSWIWVLSPLWILFLLVVFMLWIIDLVISKL